MAKKEKKMAAALAAVNAYLQEEEELALRESVDAHEAHPPLLFWAQAGRQDMMAMRRMVQMRAFSRLH